MIGHVRFRSAVRASALGMILASTASAQTVTLNPRWTHQSGAENWVAREVAIGNEGTEVFAQLAAGGLSKRLFTEGSTSVASPAWQLTDGQQTFYHRVAGCEGSSLYATASDEQTTSGHVLQLRSYRSSSSSPAWNYTSPAQATAYQNFGVMITPSGEKIVLAYYSFTTGRTEVIRFNPASSAPASACSIQTYGAPNALYLSNDGQSLFVGTSMAGTVVDLGTGQIRYQNITSTQGVSTYAFSGDGTTFAMGVYGAVCIFHRGTTGTWTNTFNCVLPTGAVSLCAAISSDGSRLALSYDLLPGVGDAVVQLLDLPASLQAGSPVVKWTHAVAADHALQNQAADIRLSQDGKVLAVGFWGDDGGPSPELLVYKDDVGVPALATQLPGSIQRVSMSADGRHLVAALKSRHNSIATSASSIAYFDLVAADIEVVGVPHSGGSVGLRAQTTPGRALRVLAASARNQAPTPMGTVGLLQLDRTMLIGSISMGVADGTGVCTANWNLNGIPAGTSLYFQSLALAPRELGHDWCKITVVP